ncbi:phosphatidylinositol glycan anchor biosynthesis class S isoform X1 [Dermacentor variabilis]|uniref:phosphatidylinositol glycan anchor biosynthesis class S isoform X1 n=1 Tax=Dermacentor variabilis TaxID=34621 RepID=UPI003F5C6423
MSSPSAPSVSSLKHAENKGLAHVSASLSFILIFVFVGLPVWWKTTTVYRVNLPYDEIEALSTVTAIHRIKVEVVSCDASVPVRKGFIQRLEEASRRDAANIAEVSFAYEWTVREAHQNETTLFAKQLSDVDEVLHKTDLFESRNQLYVVIAPEGSTDESVTVGLHQIVYVKVNNDVGILCNNIVSAVRQYAIRESTLKRLHTSHKATERAKLDKERMRPLSAATEFDVTFTLVVPEPQTLDVSWRIEDAVEVYLKPFLEKISLVAKVHVKSQVLFLTPLKLRRRFNQTSGAYIATADQLSLIINPIEGSTGFQASIRPVLNFVVYVVPQTHYPLYIYDDQGNQLQTNSFLSPKWGGVLFYNVAKFPGPGDTLPQPVEIDMRSVFQVFLAQLSLLVGLPDKSYDRAVHYLESPMPSYLDVAFLLRRRTQDYLSMSSSSLKSLSELLSKISNIVVKDEIGELIYSSVSYAKQSFDLLNRGDLENAFRNAEAAFLASEKAFFDPSLLALLYFPDDQKYAIYIPLFLPISLPVVLSIRGLWCYYKNRKTPKTEKQD